MVMTQEMLYTVEEVAAQMRVNTVTVRRWLQAGRLGGFMPGGRRVGWRIRQTDLERFISQGPAEREGA